MCKELIRFKIQIHKRSNGGSQATHGDGCLKVVADDITDDEPDPGSGHRDDIEPVPTKAPLAGRGEIARGDFHRRLPGEMVRQQAALQRKGDLTFTSVATGIVQRNRRSFGAFLCDSHVFLVEGGLARGPLENDCAESDSLCSNWGDQARTSGRFIQYSSPRPAASLSSNSDFVGHDIQHCLTPHHGSQDGGTRHTGIAHRFVRPGHGDADEYGPASNPAHLRSDRFPAGKWAYARQDFLQDVHTNAVREARHHHICQGLSGPRYIQDGAGAAAHLMDEVTPIDAP